MCVTSGQDLMLVCRSRAAFMSGLLVFLFVVTRGSKENLLLIDFVAVFKPTANYTLQLNISSENKDTNQI